MEGAHKHSFTKIKMFAITKGLQDDYKGVAGDRAFLTRECMCGKVQAFDYGLTKNIKTKLKELNDGTITGTQSNS